MMIIKVNNVKNAKPAAYHAKLYMGIVLLVQLIEQELNAIAKKVFLKIKTPENVQKYKAQARAI